MTPTAYCESAKYFSMTLSMNVKVCTISFERPVNYLCDAWHVFPPKYEAKRGLILIGLELNTNARESFEHC